MYINIHNGFLTKALFKGKKTDVNIIFEYQDGKLKKEKYFIVLLAECLLMKNILTKRMPLS